MYKKLTIAACLSLVFAFLAVGVFASSNHDSENNHENFRRGGNPELNRKACSSEGRAVIDIKQKVRNDADSGESGNYWAFDYYTRNIKVWQSDDNNPETWCALVTYEGDFFAVPGQVGPGNRPPGEQIDSPVNGDMRGGYRATITGAAPTSSDSAWPLKGNIGTTNYKCDILGNCPGKVDWIAKYFGPSAGFEFLYWGWTYKAHDHGTWVNQCSSDIPTNPACVGNSGNIL